MQSAHLADLPDRFETERLVVRRMRPGDGAVLCQAQLDSLTELRQFPASLPWALEDPTIERSEIFCREGDARFIALREFRFLILLRGESTVVGCCALSNPDWTVPAVDIGWWGRTPYLNCGYISEAVTRLIQFGFNQLGVINVRAFVDELNHRSIRVCERAGMTLCAVMHNERADPDGTLRNTLLYTASRARC